MKSVYGAILSGAAFVLIASPQAAWADATPECNVENEIKMLKSGNKIKLFKLILSVI